MQSSCYFFVLFFFNDTATTEIYTLSLHDALPIFATILFLLAYLATERRPLPRTSAIVLAFFAAFALGWFMVGRSEEHTSELQSQSNLVCRLLLEKKKKNKKLFLSTTYLHI